MSKPGLTILRFVSNKWTAFLACCLLAAVSFATLGDGNKKSSASKSNGLLSSRTSSSSFSLRSGYNFRGAQVISNDKKYLSLNTVVTLQKGKTTFVLPLKKKVLINNISLDLGNRQFRK